jgi:outer membrane autotransporter protein
MRHNLGPSYLTGEVGRLWSTPNREKLGIRRIKRLRFQHWRLLGAALVMAVLLVPDLCAATDLTVDNTLFNSPYAVTTDINFDNEISGNTSTGIMNQSGFTNTVTDKFYLGYSPASSGTYNLSGTGSLAATNQYVGNSGNGSFNQSGGTNIGSVLYLGNLSGSSGVYTLSGGSLSIIGEIIGDFGSGIFIQTGGIHTGNGNLSLGISPGGLGTYNQSGGSNTVAGILSLGYNAGGLGTYNLSGGSLSAGFGFVGYQGLGVFNQSGGTNSISSNLQLGFASGSSGTYNLSGGSLYTSTLYVGKNANGIFNQSGGSTTIEKLNSVSGLYLGFYPGISGTYNLSGGTLSAPAETIGVLVGGVGIFNQSGGTNTVTDVLTLGYRNGSSGTYNLSGGSLLTDFEAIGYQGLGAFNQSGGSITVTSDLILGDWIAGSGAYALSGGSLFTNNTVVGNGGSGTFTQTGGSHTVSHTLTLAAIPGRSGTYNLQGGSLTAGTVNLNLGGAFSQTGGNLNAAIFNQQGGTVAGALSNHGTFNYISGTFSGRLLNYGAANFNADFTAANGLANYSAMGIDAGRTVTLNGQGLDNQGSLVVNGTLIGGGPLLNYTNGFLGGTGTLQGAFTNRGTVNPGNSVGTLNVEGSYTQTARGILQVEIASATSYDQLRVMGVPGTAILNGALTPTLLNGYRPQAGQVFGGVVSATGGISGAFSTLSNFTPTLVAQPLYAANRVDLLVQRDYTNPFLAPLSRNQYAVGSMLNGLAGATSGDLNMVLDTIDGLPASPNVRDAFKQISPEKASALSTLGFAAATFQVRNLATRTTNLRFVQGGSGEGGRVNSGNLGFNYSRLDGLMLAYNGASLSNLFSARKEFKAPESRWGIFADGGAAFGRQNSSTSQTGYNFSLGGFTAGADYRLRDNLLVGLATGYSNTNSSFSGSGGSVTANTIPFNAYTTYFPGSFYAYGSVGYALNLYDLKRGINFGDLARTGSSYTNGNQFNLYGETGYDLRLSRFILTPSATLAYSALWVGGFTEQGAGSLNLKVASQSADSLQTGLGGRLTVPFEAGSVKLVPQGYAFYQHEFSNGSRSLNANLSQGSSTFNFQTDAAKRNFAVVGANVTVGIKKNLYAQVNYNAEVGRGNSTAQNLNAGLRLEF